MHCSEFLVLPAARVTKLLCKWGMCHKGLDGKVYRERLLPTGPWIWLKEKHLVFFSVAGDECINLVNESIGLNNSIQFRLHITVISPNFQVQVPYLMASLMSCVILFSFCPFDIMILATSTTNSPL